MKKALFSAALALALLQACTSDGPQTATTPERETDPFEGCVRGTLESDHRSTPLAGAAVRDGVLAPGQYVVSSTYLQLEPAQNGRFQELMGPIKADLASRDGLLALSLGSSDSCSVGRTLTVWRDEAAMLEFVVGKAHAAAMGEVSELSRGGSVVTHWSGDRDSASWPVAAEHLAADDGPEY